MKHLISIVSIILLLSSCSNFRFPGVHRLTIQQGNVITQIMVDKLKPGMTKSQVRYVLGNPVVDDQLDQERWDYIYTIQIPDRDYVQQRLQVYFIDNRLSYFEGDYSPTVEEPEAEKTAQTEETAED